MESRPYVSLPATQATPLHSEEYPHDQVSEFMVSRHSSSGYLPIKAPLSLDSDFDIHVRSNEHAISTSGSECEFEDGGFASGEDEFEFETASERPFVAYPDEETSVDSDDVEEYVLASPLLSAPYNETLDYDVDDHAPAFVPIVVDDGQLKCTMPTARLSMDGDYDDESCEEELSEVEDGRITGIKVLEKIDSVPKFKVLGAEGEDDSLLWEDYSALNQLRPQIKVNLEGFAEVGNGFLGSEKAESFVAEESVNDLDSADSVESRNLVISEEARVEASVHASAVDQEDTVEENLKLNETVNCSFRESQVLRELDNQGSEWKGRDKGEQKTSEFSTSDEVRMKLLSQRDLLIDVKEPPQVVEESLMMVNGTDVVEEHNESISVEYRANSTGGKEIESVNQTKISILNPPHETKYLGNGSSPGATQDVILEDGIYSKSSDSSSVLSSHLDPDVEVQDADVGVLVFGSSVTAKQNMNEEKQIVCPTSGLGTQILRHHLQTVEGQTVKDTDEKKEGNEDDGEKKTVDSAALTALRKTTPGRGSDGDGGDVIFTSADGSGVFSLKRPVEPGSMLRHSAQANGLNLSISSDLKAISEEEKNKLEKIHVMTVRFLRLVQRLGHSPEDSIVAKVLFQLLLAAEKHSNEPFNLESAKRTAMQLEAEGTDDIDFSLNILLLGKTGVGKSATINSIFCEEKAMTDAFQPATSTVNEIFGTIDGVKIRVFDTPGLRSSVMEQAFNQKILLSTKKYMKKFPPDVVLYVDRLDTSDRDLNDLLLLRSITSSLGSSIWKNAIVVLTHGAASPPDGPSGSPLSYESFVSQRSYSVHQSISHSVGDLHLMNPSLINPVSLVENHPLCRKNGNCEKLLPNGQDWQSQLLLLCYSIKILSDASSILQRPDPFGHGKLFGFRIHSPPLPYFLSSLLQSHTHPKLSTDHSGVDVDSDIELGDMIETDQEDEEEYDQLPPFKPLGRSQIANLSKGQREAYFEEYDYRVKLLQRKQWKEELKRLREKKRKCRDDGNENGCMGGNGDKEYGSPATVLVPTPDMVLPPSFDGDNPAYRYRSLEAMSQLLARPILVPHCWDHDCGYDGISLEESLAIAGIFPSEIAIQVTKGKNEFNIHFDSSVSVKQGENGSTMAGFNIQTIGRQAAYILRGETKLRNFRINKTAVGVSLTFLGKNMATGFKIEDQIAAGRHLVFVGSTGAVQSQEDAAYGANFEVHLKKNDFPIEQDQATLGLSLMKWRNDLALTANLQSQFPIGRSSKMAVHVGLNNKQSGQITVRTSSSEQVHIALMGILPIAITIFRSICRGSGQKP